MCISCDSGICVLTDIADSNRVMYIICVSSVCVGVGVGVGVCECVVNSTYCTYHV